MNRREFLREVSVQTIAVASTASSILDGRASGAPGGNAEPLAEPGTRTDWLARWQKNILDSARSRYCDKEMGEELGWLVSPFLNGFYYEQNHIARWLIAAPQLLKTHAQSTAPKYLVHLSPF